MQQVKLFKSLESDLTALEAEANAWIRQSRAKVISITGNIAPQSAKTGSTAEGLSRSQFSPSDVVLIVLYDTPTS